MKQQEIEAVIKNYGTPVYVFDLDALTQHVSKISTFLKQEQINLCYAMKANPFLTGELEPYIERFEVCSPGEFRICEREHLPIEHLVISGVNKEKEDIFRIVENYQGKGIFTIESEQQRDLLLECARESKLKLQALVRISSGNQFGVSYELAKKMFASQKNHPELSLRGIQYYSGTQKKKLSLMEEELQKLDIFCMEVKEELKIEIEELEYGPGFFVPYFQSDSEEDLETLLKTFLEFVHNMKFQGKITLEMGRFLVANCGYFVTSIIDQKENSGQIFGIVDGGIHHLNYFGQTMAMKHPYIQHISDRKEENQIKKWNICGSLCTTADVIVKQFPLVGAKIGDVLVFERAGAYSVTEGINLFLSRDLPKVLFYSKESGFRLIRDTQVTDVFNSKTNIL
ncbi:MAG: alanine racemase [Lachnospiraceae bacterium]